MSIKYHCYDEGNDPERDYREIVADSPKEAAEKHRTLDDAETLTWASESDVFVKNCRTGVVEVFTVTCRAEPVYSARKKR